MEALLLHKKSLLSRVVPESQSQRVFKLKVLSESLSGSVSKTEERNTENRIQKEGALKFRVVKTGEISQLEKELEDEIKVLENQRDELEAALKKKQSMSICFVLSWYIGFAAICKEDLLSLNTSTGRITSFPTSFIKPRIHTNTAVTAARLLNSASAELLETVVCFFDF
ncbi:hypothetical protein BC332_23201 [Capsicum chinense]|nr:hypothetical protein BC332_23201 [Capsicum chinense]